MAEGKTLAVLIGVSRNPHYEELGAPAKDVTALAAALIASNGCGLATGDVVSLTDEGATAAAIRAAISRFASEASEQDRLFIYFAGHGERLEQDFGLVAWDTDPCKKVPSLRGSELNELLATTRALGVLLLIDCCYGANFAEYAPDFFKTTVRGGYRVLLSSTRGDEKSWEIIQGGSTMFSKHLRLVLEGAVPVGFVPGVIFLSDLARHIARNVDADLRLLSPEYHQEQMFQGVYGKDPILFQNKNLTEYRLLMLLARYSLQDILRFFRIAATCILITVVSAFLVHYSILDRSRYAATSETRIEIFVGRHGWNAYQFPELLWQTDFYADDMSTISPLRANQGAVNAPIESSVLPVLKSHLAATASLRWAYWNGEFGTVRDELKKLWSAQGSLKEAAWLLPKVSEKEDVPWLAEVAAETREDITRANAWIAVARLAPGNAASGLLQGRREPYTFPMELLSTLQPPCDELKQSYTASLLTKVAVQDYRSAAVNAALRLDCRLSTDELAMALVESFNLSAAEDLAGYIDSTHQFGSGLLELLPAFSMADHKRSDLSRKAMAVIARSRRASCLPPLVRQLEADDDATVVAAAAALLVHCPGDMVERVREKAKLKPELIAVLAMHGGVSPAEVRTRLDAVELDVFEAAYLLLALGAVGSQDDAAEIVRFVGKRPVGEEGVRIAAVAALHRLRAPSSMARPFLGGLFESSEMALSWVVDVDPAEGRRLMREATRGKNSAGFSRVARQLQLGPDDIDFLEEQLNGPSAGTAAAILAQVTSPARVAGLLSSPIAAIRTAALRYAVANPLIDKEVLKSIRSVVPGPVQGRLADDLRNREEINEILLQTAPDLRAWRAKLIYATWRPQLSPGHKVILDRERDASRQAAYWEFRRGLP